MGAQTHFFTRLVLDGTIQSEAELDIEILRTSIRIRELQEEFEAYTLMTEPNKFVPEGTDTFTYFRDKIRTVLAELDELCVTRRDLMLLKDRWNACHTEDGKAINPPEGTFKTWDESYLSGDYINVTSIDDLK